MPATDDVFPIPTEGFIKLRRADLTEFVSYIYIHDITDELNVVRYRLIEIHTGYDELAENAEWENYFAIREKQAVAEFAGDIASQLNNALAGLPGMLIKSGVLNLADNGQSLKALVDIAQNLTNIANNALNMRSALSMDPGQESAVVVKHWLSSQKRNRILVVDDDLPLLEILSDSLTQRSKTVLTATSIAEAMAIAESHDLDAVLIDLRLGNENGRELATKLKTLNSNLHIVYMTGYATSIPRIRRHENYDILRKPFTLEDALIAIEKSVD
jgi:CheY-like chemotaxis protein